MRKKFSISIEPSLFTVLDNYAKDEKIKRSRVVEDILKLHFKVNPR